MSEPFLAEIRIVGFTFAPRGWALCDGQILPINQNQSLYSLLGTTYGGDGRTSFALPDLRGRTPIHIGSSNGSLHQLGSKSGEETHTLNAAEMASHTHSANAISNPAETRRPEDALPAMAENNIYKTGAGAANLKAMAAQVVAKTGGGQAHNNMQPCLALNFCIALQGLFPSRN